MLPELLDQIPPEQKLGSVTADGVYDTRLGHEAIAPRDAHAAIPVTYIRPDQGEVRLNDLCNKDSLWSFSLPDTSFLGMRSESCLRQVCKIFADWPVKLIRRRLYASSANEEVMAKKGEQIAALPMRWDKDGKLEVLMVTSRGTGRWIVPKGWEMDDTKPWKAASIEALEEAGIKGRISRDMIGTYKYDKILDSGKKLPCVVRVYPMIVQKMKNDWKERKQRRRRWFSPKSAARRVHEKQLAKILKSLERKPRKQPVIRELLKAS